MKKIIMALALGTSCTLAVPVMAHCNMDGIKYFSLTVHNRTKQALYFEFDPRGQEGKIDGQPYAYLPVGTTSSTIACSNGPTSNLKIKVQLTRFDDPTHLIASWKVHLQPGKPGTITTASDHSCRIYYQTLWADKNGWVHHGQYTNKLPVVKAVVRYVSADAWCQ